MRIGYSYWGFVGDHKEDERGDPLSTPDGNAAYGLFLVDALQRAGHQIVMMQYDRDWAAFRRHGRYDFEAFSRDRRCRAYLGMERSLQNQGQPHQEMTEPRFIFPELDALLLEWRFPIPGRNTPDARGRPGYQPDLERQDELISHYSRRVPIIVWDLDHKLTLDDEQQMANWGGPGAILETSIRPRDQMWMRTRVEPPVVVSDLLQHPMRPPDPKKKLVYVGSRYERDDVIDEWIRPVSERFPQEIQFYGNWTAEYNLANVQEKWPTIKYMDRISMKDFRNAYGDAVACPLLAKRSYLEVGFITPRIWEALVFGTLPVGLRSHHGIENYLPQQLIADDAQDLGNIVENLAGATQDHREKLRRMVVERIGFMDADNFVRVIEGVVNG